MITWQPLDHLGTSWWPQSYLDDLKAVWMTLKLSGWPWVQTSCWPWIPDLIVTLDHPVDLGAFYDFDFLITLSPWIFVLEVLVQGVLYVCSVSDQDLLICLIQIFVIAVFSMSVPDYICKLHISIIFNHITQCWIYCVYIGTYSLYWCLYYL